MQDSNVVFEKCEACGCNIDQYGCTTQSAGNCDLTSRDDWYYNSACRERDAAEGKLNTLRTMWKRFDESGERIPMYKLHDILFEACVRNP